MPMVRPRMVCGERASDDEEIGRVEMNEIYSELFWRLFDDLGLSLDPAGPDELYEVAAPFMAAGNESST